MASAPQWVRAQHDTGLGFSMQLRHPADFTQRIGDIVDLSNATAVYWLGVRSYDGVVVLDTQAEVVGLPSNGVVSTPCTAAVTAQPGLVEMQIVVDWPDGQQLTFPAEPGNNRMYLRVRERIVSTVVPQRVSGPSIGVEAVPASIFIPDGSANTVSMSGAVVFAGANATVNVDPQVVNFSIAEWPGQTPWSAGTTPTIVHAGTTVHGTVTARMLASDGDEVTIARDGLAGAVWFASAPATGGSSYTPPTIHPVFVPNGGVGTIAFDGQIAFVGDAAVVNVAAGVRSFSIAEWPTQTPWVTMPTIVQAGTTMHASVAQQLADSDGDMVVLGSNGATWFAAAPASHAVETYEHTQAVAAITWTINHNLGRRPGGVTIQNTLGQDVVAEDISHPTVNTTVLTFLVAQAGTALLS